MSYANNIFFVPTLLFEIKVKVKHSHYRPMGPRGSLEVKASRFRDSGTGRLYPRSILALILTPGTEKIPSDTTGDRSRGLPTNSVVP
jgi:hypothetical protein